jgi:hypothetical protein
VTVAWLLMLLNNVWYATAFVRLIPDAAVCAVWSALDFVEVFYLAARVRLLVFLIFNSSGSAGGKSPSSSFSRSSS